VIGEFKIGGQSVRVDFSRGICLAIVLDFDGPQPSHFDAPSARATPMCADGFVGDTRRGGSCNVPVLTLNPHCNGTHSESVAHIVDEPMPINQALPGRPIPASLVTVTPVPALDSGEHYCPALVAADRLITAANLKAALDSQSEAWLEAVVIRTNPNGADKQTRHYGADCPAPFFSIEAMDYLVGRNVRHLLVDIPSVDRMHDEGRLTAHHRFWRIQEANHNLDQGVRLDATITELIYVADAVPDGVYLLDIQVPAFVTDVAPSRPWLYSVAATS
jgi:kynurenine formamidase